MLEAAWQPASTDVLAWPASQSDDRHCDEDADGWRDREREHGWGVLRASTDGGRDGIRDGAATGVIEEEEAGLCGEQGDGECREDGRPRGRVRERLPEAVAGVRSREVPWEPPASRLRPADRTANALVHPLEQTVN